MKNEQEEKSKRTSKRKQVSAILNPLKTGEYSKYLNPKILDLIRNPDNFAQKIAQNIEEIEKSDLDVRERLILVNTLLSVFKTFGDYYKPIPQLDEEAQSWKKDALDFIDLWEKETRGRKELKNYLLSWLVPRLSIEEKEQFDRELYSFERKFWNGDLVIVKNQEGKPDHMIEVVYPKEKVTTQKEPKKEQELKEKQEDETYL
ncbi:MAG: hypothetical protein WC796_01940 [Candidatus Pacearchaeota archaeon]|jgi:hypothetical protein